MRDEPFYHQDDPTEPVRKSLPPYSDQQDKKMIIGSFQDTPKQSERKPYHYPSPSQYADQAKTYQQSQQPYPVQNRAQGNMPGRNANAQPYPYSQPGQQLPPGG